MTRYVDYMIKHIAANAASQEHTAVQTLETLCDIEFADTATNFRFRPRGVRPSFTITGARELSFSQDCDGLCVVQVLDAGHPADDDATRRAETRSIIVSDPAGIALLNAIVKLLASPVDHPAEPSD